MAAAHQIQPIQDPLNNLEKITKKPWMYTSGGTIKNLIAAYWSRTEPPKSEERWVENPMELLVFLADLIKQSPSKLIDLYLKHPKKHLVMYSPPHAFNLLPGRPLFSECWKEESFTYTWIRDQFLKERKEFIETLILDEEMIETLLELISERLPDEIRTYFKQSYRHFAGRYNPIEFRRELLKIHGRLSPSWVDQCLYDFLPLLPKYQFDERLSYLVEECIEIPQVLRKKMLSQYEENPLAYSIEKYIPVERNYSRLQKLCTASVQNKPILLLISTKSFYLRRDD